MRIVTLARKPFETSTVENILVNGTGALHIEATRIPTDDCLDGGAYAKLGTARHDGAQNWRFRRTGDGAFEQPSGRWPSNLLLIIEPRLFDGSLGRYFKVFSR